MACVARDLDGLSAGGIFDSPLAGYVFDSPLAGCVFDSPLAGCVSGHACFAAGPRASGGGEPSAVSVQGASNRPVVVTCSTRPTLRALDTGAASRNFSPSCPSGHSRPHRHADRDGEPTAEGAFVGPRGLAGPSGRGRDGCRMPGLTLLLLAGITAWFTACASPPTFAPPASKPWPRTTDPVAEKRPGLEIQGQRIPVVVLKTRQARDEYSIPPRSVQNQHEESRPHPLPETGRTEKERFQAWRSPLDWLELEGKDVAVLHAYPGARPRPLALRDAAGRSVDVVFLDGAGRVVQHQRVALGAAYRVIDPGAPIRFVLFLRPGFRGESRLAPGTPVRLPREALLDAEEESDPDHDPPAVEIRVAGIPLRVEVADHGASRRRGLMYRDRVPEGTGMLFMYTEDDVLSYWMLNTRIPLDVAYVDRNRVIRRVVRLEPFDLVGRSSEVPVRMALEVPAGWFERHGIKEGDRITLLSSLRSTLEPQGEGPVR